jgi:hypothetical protein
MWVLAGILTVGTIAGLFWYAGHLVKQDDKLRREGVPADARVLALRQTGTWSANNPQVEIELEIQIPGKDPYTIRTVKVIPVVNAPSVQPGAILHIKVAADDPNRIVIDEPWSR